MKKSKKILISKQVKINLELKFKKILMDLGNIEK